MSSTNEVTPSQWQIYTDLARELGFAQIAAAPDHDIHCKDTLRDWVRRGYHASMHWFERGLEKRLNLSLVMEDAASVIVLTAPYHPEPCTLAGHKLARYACGDDYHDVLIVWLRQLCERMAVDFPNARFRPYVDTGPVLERYWAWQSGLGWIGRNGNLISRQNGSYLFLSCIVTNLVVPYGSAHDNFCGSCTACIEACPTDAIVADGVVDSRRCISYLSIEHRGDFPEETPSFDGWLFGCDICQEVCPWPQKFSSDDVAAPFRPRDSYTLDSEELAEIPQESFSRLFRKSPVKRTKMKGIKRNLAHLQKARQAATHRESEQGEPSGDDNI